MPAAPTYDALATTTLSSSQSTITFSSISASYTDLVIVITGTASGATSNVGVRFNGDSASNYNGQRLLSDGGATSAERQNTNYIMVGDVNTALFIGTIHLNNYSDTETFKTALSSMGNASAYYGIYSGTWRSTAAINQIDIIKPGQTFSSGTTVDLYGIQKA